jgi:hypothetical protein
MTHRKAAFAREIDARGDPALDAVNHGATAKRNAYQRIFDVTEEKNPHSRFVVFAVSTLGLIGAEAMKFLKDECGINEGGVPDLLTVTTMRRIINAISCETQRSRGLAVVTAIETGYQDRPQFVLVDGALLPGRNEIDINEHPSAMTRNILTAGHLPSDMFAYRSHFSSTPPPPPQPSPPRRPTTAAMSVATTIASIGSVTTTDRRNRQGRSGAMSVATTIPSIGSATTTGRRRPTPTLGSQISALSTTQTIGTQSQAAHLTQSQSTPGTGRTPRRARAQHNYANLNAGDIDAASQQPPDSLQSSQASTETPSQGRRLNR